MPHDKTYLQTEKKDVQVRKAKDPGFGGLVLVMNKRNEFLWVHKKFAGEY